METENRLKPLLDFLKDAGIENVAHTKRTYAAHLVGVYRLMEEHGCSEELCRAGLFHSIYGTELFQGFKLPLEKRQAIRALIGERAERLAYLNCAMDRASFDRGLAQTDGPYHVLDRLTGAEVEVAREDFDDLCRVHLFDWLEQVPRTRNFIYRPRAYRRMAERIGSGALETLEKIYPAVATSAGGES